MSKVMLQMCGDFLTAASPTGAQGPVGGFRQALYNQLVAAGLVAGTDFQFDGSRNSGDIVGLGWAGVHSGWANYGVVNLQNVLTPSAQGGGGGSPTDITLNALLVGTYDCVLTAGDTTVAQVVNPLNLLPQFMLTLASLSPGSLFAVMKIPPLDDTKIGYTGPAARATWWNANIDAQIQAAQALGLNVALYDPGLVAADLGADGITPGASGWTKLANTYQIAVTAAWYQANHPAPARPNPR